MARHFGVTDDMMMQEGADKSLLYDWMYYGTKYGSNGALGGHGWADFEVLSGLIYPPDRATTPSSYCIYISRVSILQLRFAFRLACEVSESTV